MNTIKNALTSSTLELHGRLNFSLKKNDFYYGVNHEPCHNTLKIINVETKDSVISI